MSVPVYRMRQTLAHNKDRPDYVTYNDPEGWFATDEGWKVFQGNVFVSLGKSGHPPERWFVPDLCANQKGKTKIDAWDFYECHTFGAFSPRAISVLKPFFDDRFGTLPAMLEGHQYVCLHCRSRSDCLDRAASVVEHSPVSHEVARIATYVFNKAALPADPAIFAIPEMPFALYCTKSVRKSAVAAGLRGIKFEVVDRVG